MMPFLPLEHRMSPSVLDRRSVSVAATLVGIVVVRV
jgi:hypothetical protein